METISSQIADALRPMVQSMPLIFDSAFDIYLEEIPFEVFSDEYRDYRATFAAVQSDLQ